VAVKSEAQIIEHQGIVVVRDDLFPGGTKARVLDVLLTGAGEFVYASPVYGYAQIALAYTARRRGKRATIFCAQRKTLHARTLEAQNAGARIVQVPAGYMTVLRARARSYCQTTGAQLLPHGLDAPIFLAALADYARSLPVRPKEVWAVAGSGVLIRALQLAWPRARFHAVRVGGPPDTGGALVYQAPEKFEHDASVQPPFPSCSNYDAKAWRFIKQHAAPGALFWNVAA
jgi:hypothetical protein